MSKKLHISTFITFGILLVIISIPIKVNAFSFYDKTHTWNMPLMPGESLAVFWDGFAQAIASKPNTEVKNRVTTPLLPVPPAQSNSTGPQFAVAGGAGALANSSFTANANGTGSHTLSGFADLGTGQSALSRATSKIALRKFAFNAQGLFQWRGNWVIDVLRSGQETDPIFFSVVDLDTGDIIESELFSFVVDLHGPGSASWLDGVVEVDGMAGSLSIEMESPFITTGTGSLSLDFANGLITTSDDTGIFDGLLPGVGAPSNFSFNLGGTDGFVDIGYDFGPENINGYDIMVDLSAEAIVQEAVPEPSTIALLGIGLAGLAGAEVRRRRKKKAVIKAR